MYQSGYRPQNLPALPAAAVNCLCFLHHAPPQDLVPSRNSGVAMERGGGFRWTRRIGQWLRSGKRVRGAGVVGKMWLLPLLFAGQGLLFARSSREKEKAPFPDVTRAGLSRRCFSGLFFGCQSYRDIEPAQQVQ